MIIIIHPCFIAPNKLYDIRYYWHTLQRFSVVSNVSATYKAQFSEAGYDYGEDPSKLQHRCVDYLGD